MNMLNTYYYPYRNTAKGMWVPPLERLPLWRTGACRGASGGASPRPPSGSEGAWPSRSMAGDPRRSPARSRDALPEEASQDENDSSSAPRLTPRHGRTMLQWLRRRRQHCSVAQAIPVAVEKRR
ncbi:hypothetical protein MUK42_09215 [Musa troglodytarum]|uniref:Uncharacterized protein n=1 Tax=Musa troglodytarum TaxID=320322 RepID=A0A9E7I7E7_9LILI|nr:hypothetical protein MUK42_09215 [Musa troglodytarum]